MLWTCMGCSNTRLMFSALVAEHPELAPIVWPRTAAGGGGAIDNWYLSIQGQGRKDFAGQYVKLQALYGTATDVIFQCCIRQTPIPPESTSQQQVWHRGICEWLREVSPGVRIHFLPLPRYETDCRGGSEQWPVAQVGLELAVMHSEGSDAIIPPLDPYTVENTQEDNCHPTPERSSYEAGHVASYILGVE